MIVLGHRGGRGPGWPEENSLAAFARALAEGADGFELDVRRCRSGELVVTHDPELPDGRAVVAVDRHAAPWATLDEALELGAGRIVNVEVKPQPRRLGAVRETARVLRRHPRAEVVLSSFDPAIVAALAVAAPRTPRALLVGTRTPRLVTALPRALGPLLVAAHVDDVLVTPERIARLRGAGLRAVVWTVNDGARARALRAMGAACLITDTPGAIRAALASAV